MIDQNIEITKVRSASKTYLLFGIVAIAMIVLLELTVIRHFFIAELSESIFLAVILQVPASLLFLIGHVYLDAYQRNAEFDMMYCQLEDADVNWIKKKYYICKIDTNGMIFVDRENRQLYHDWAVMHQITNTSEAFTILWAKGGAATC